MKKIIFLIMSMIVMSFTGCEINIDTSSKKELPTTNHTIIKSNPILTDTSKKYNCVFDGKWKCNEFKEVDFNEFFGNTTSKDVTYKYTSCKSDPLGLFSDKCNTKFVTPKGQQVLNAFYQNDSKQLNELLKEHNYTTFGHKCKSDTKIGDRFTRSTSWRNKHFRDSSLTKLAITYGYVKNDTLQCTTIMNDSIIHQWDILKNGSLSSSN